MPHRHDTESPIIQNISKVEPIVTSKIALFSFKGPQYAHSHFIRERGRERKREREREIHLMIIWPNANIAEPPSKARHKHIPTMLHEIIYMVPSTQRNG